MAVAAALRRLGRLLRPAPEAVWTLMPTTDGIQLVRALPLRAPPASRAPPRGTTAEARRFFTTSHGAPGPKEAQLPPLQTPPPPYPPASRAPPRCPTTEARSTTATGTNEAPPAPAPPSPPPPRLSPLLPSLPPGSTDLYHYIYFLESQSLERYMRLNEYQISLERKVDKAIIQYGMSMINAHQQVGVTGWRVACTVLGGFGGLVAFAFPYIKESVKRDVLQEIEVNQIKTDQVPETPEEIPETPEEIPEQPEEIPGTAVASGGFA